MRTGETSALVQFGHFELEEISKTVTGLELEDTNIVAVDIVG
jgi:hypothetical protein